MRALALFTILFLLCIPARSQDEETPGFSTYRGEVVDADSGKPLVFADVSIFGENISTVTNSEGQFLLKVPEALSNVTVRFNYLGYHSRSLPLSELQEEGNEIELEVAVTELAEVNLSAPKDAVILVKETLRNKQEKYLDDLSKMTAFYRETIKRRRRNVSLSEAVVDIYKMPYDSPREDVMELYKARKSTDYSRLDTLVLKLQGGPYNTLLVDILKYPDYLFTESSMDLYDFRFDRSTRINNQLIYVVDFQQREGITEPFYRGKLYIDAERKILTRAVFALNITDREEASKLFVRKKPRNASVYPEEVAYRVDYRERNGKWYYGYSNVLLEFKVDWDRKLFNTVYSLTCEMAITDATPTTMDQLPRPKDRLKPSVILSDDADGFSDPDFWGEYNIIEPEKSIESAIRKIQRQLRRDEARE